jgi:hypothetical protein
LNAPRIIRDFSNLVIASRGLRRASKLDSRGQTAEAAQRYQQVIRRLDSVGSIPSDPTKFSLRDILHFSIRIVACANLAVLLDRAGERERAKGLAQEVQYLAESAPRRPKDQEAFEKWARWARAFLGREDSPH